MAGGSGDAGVIRLYNTNGASRIELDGYGLNGGSTLTLDANDGSATIELIGESSSSAGLIEVNNSSGSVRAVVNGEHDTHGGGYVNLYADDGSSTMTHYGDYGDGAGLIQVRNDSGATRSEIDGKGYGSGGEVVLYDSTGTEVANLRASGGGALNLYDGGDIIVEESDGTSGARISGGTGGYGYFYQHDGDYGLYLDGDAGTDTGGRLMVYDAAGSATITLDGDYGGDGRVICDEIQINGGSDLSEQFDIDKPAAPGSVVCIDSDNPGKLVICRNAYDRSVAGIVSGAGGVKPGMMMGQEGTVANGEYPVALSGRVYCRVDASQGAIQPGDLITTSDVPGHGMKVTDHSRAHGAIIGKAMTGLESGQGLVLVLVSLH
jgi:hypothetical protein